MGGDLGEAGSAGEGGHDHFHLDGGVAGAEAEGVEEVGAEGAEAVLGVGEA